jgi:hypothetical protein
MGRKPFDFLCIRVIYPGAPGEHIRPLMVLTAENRHCV